MIEAQHADEVPGRVLSGAKNAATASVSQALKAAKRSESWRKKAWVSAGSGRAWAARVEDWLASGARGRSVARRTRDTRPCGQRLELGRRESCGGFRVRPRWSLLRQRLRGPE